MWPREWSLFFFCIVFPNAREYCSSNPIPFMAESGVGRCRDHDCVFPTVRKRAANTESIEYQGSRIRE